ncbi:transposase-like protein [Saccharopolyspora lacisalsi]|uniref:Transposase-like protein n=1 Tax=Halosaccharopolyspora lacisalsi TaxID=1000566 RepID=A0A839DUR2_9PSEU|nr:transposase [Halosaccharopolyspora lacisalsi]MBA8824006.1 transposase-like protein [Halosaccharopolyspora lacisalsi]
MTEERRRTRRKFSAEFERDAVELVLTGGKSVAEAARDLGIYDSTLGNWVKQARIDRGQQEGSSTPGTGSIAGTGAGKREATHGAGPAQTSS